MVMTWIAKIETSVKLAATLSMRKAPRITMPPMARGRAAATRLPKMKIRRMASIGKVAVSAFSRSLLTCVLISWLMAGAPPRRTCSTLLVRRGRRLSMFLFCASSPPVNCTTA